jgi:hypothetical protein
MMVAGGAILGALLGAIWGAAHPDPFFGWDFNAFIDGSFGFTIGLVVGILLWLARSRPLRRRP